LESELNGLDFGVNNNGENTKFSVTEYEEACLKIDSIKEHLHKLEYPKEQLDRIEKSLDNLKENAKTLGKLDWKNLFVGTVISLVIELAMSPAETRVFIEVIKNIMNPIFLS